MLVSGLENLSLYKIISGDDEKCSHVHDKLCECAQDMLAKYRENQKSSKKLTIKTRATKKLLSALCEAPKGQRETRETILSALKSHAEALQGYEHLLSEKGNTYALVKQTQALREDHDHASASLLRYHELKDKFLGSDTPLDDKQKKVLSELSEKKDLTLKMLKAIDKDFPKDSRVFEVSCLSDTPGDHVNMPEIIRTDIINAMKKMGYHPNDRGMCYGIVWAALLACVRQDGQAYMQRMQYLKQMYIPPLHRADAYQVYPFFDAVTLSQANYEDMSGYSKGIGHPGRQEVAFPGSIIKSHIPDYQVVPVVKHAFIAECTSRMFIQFLQQTWENNKGIPFGVIITYPDHVTSIGFDGNKWLAVNHDNHYYTENTELLCTFLDRQSIFHKNGRMIAQIEVIASKGHSITINKDALVVNVKETMSTPIVLQLALECGDVSVTNECITVIGQQANSPEILFEQLAYEYVEGMPGFHMTLNNGHAGTVTSFIQESLTAISTFALLEEKKVILLYKLLTSKRSDGTPGLFMAFQKGHSDSISAFIKKSAAVIARFSLSKPEKIKWLCKLFACKRTDGTSGFCIALCNGHIKAITTFIQECAAVIATLPLPKKQKIELMCELIACRLGDGTPGFYLLFKEDQPEVITAFIQANAVAAAILFDSEEEKSELLYSLFCDIINEDKLLFLLLLEEASPAVQKSFNEGIDQLPVSAEQKETLKHPTLNSAGKMDIS